MSRYNQLSHNSIVNIATSLLRNRSRAGSELIIDYIERQTIICRGMRVMHFSCHVNLKRDPAKLLDGEAEAR